MTAARSLRQNPLTLILIVCSTLWLTIDSARANRTIAIADIEAGLYLATETPGQVQAAPIVDTRVEIAISGPVARTVVRQTFSNPSGEWVEGIYTFPLPEDSAVDRLRMRIGDRLVEGEIQEKAQARKTYEAAKANGQRASLVSQERPNIFTTEVANIAPGDAITVEIQYQEPLAFDDGAFSMRFPMAIRPRYNPGKPINMMTPTGFGWSFDTDEVADASRITPPIAAADSAPPNPMRLFVTLDPGFQVGEIESPYHPVDVKPTPDGLIHVALKDEWVPADRDFELVWRPMPSAMPTAGVFTETRGNNAYHLLMVIPPDLAADSNEVPAMGREAVFIIDKSGSMGGQAIIQAKEALLLALDRLKSSERFNVVAFSSGAEPLWGAAREATRTNLAEARRFVRGIQAGGGTEMASALRLALDGATDPGRIRQIVFITDGAVGNEEALFRQITAGLGDSRLFTVGIGSAPNSFFMREAAEAGRGSFTYIGALDEVKPKMAGLFAKLERPALTDIALAWPGGHTVEMYPATVPDLYAGEPIIVTAKTKAAAAGEISVTGRHAGADYAAAVSLEGRGGHAGIGAIWARDKIRTVNRAARKPGGPGPDATRSEIVRIALAHQLVSRFTSLVAVDKGVVRPENQRLASASVPTLLPHGMDPSFAPGGLPSARDGLGAAASPAPTPPAGKVLRLREAHAETVRTVTLPAGATAAELKVVVGIALMLIAGLGFAIARRLAPRPLRWGA